MGVFRFSRGSADEDLQLLFGCRWSLAGGITTLLKEDGDVRWISPLGFLLSILGLIFWKLDQRNRRLVKNGEAALAFLDSQHDLAQQNGAPHVLKIFELAEFRPSATFHLLRRTRQPVTETVLRSRIGGALRRTFSFVGRSRVYPSACQRINRGTSQISIFEPQ